MNNLLTVSQVFFFSFLFLFLFFVAGLFFFFLSFQHVAVFSLFFFFFSFSYSLSLVCSFFFFFRWDFSKSLARLLSAVLFLYLATSWIVYPGSKACHDSMAGSRHQINTCCIAMTTIHTHIHAET